MKPVVLMTDSRATASSEVEIVHIPLIGIRQLPVNSALAHRQYDWLLLTSSNAAELFFANYPDITFSKVASIGAKTTRTLKRIGIKVDYEPPNFNQESFIAHAGSQFNHCTVVLPCSVKARPKLTDFLSQRADVTRIDLYEPTHEYGNAKKMNTAIMSGSIDVVVFMSPSAVKTYYQYFSPFQLPVLAIGPVTSRALSDVHQKQVTVEQSTKETLISKIIEMRNNHAI